MLLRWSIAWAVVSVLVGVHVLLIFLVGIRFVAPYSTDARVNRELPMSKYRARAVSHALVLPAMGDAIGAVWPPFARVALAGTLAGVAVSSSAWAHGLHDRGVS